MPFLVAKQQSYQLFATFNSPVMNVDNAKSFILTRNHLFCKQQEFFKHRKMTTFDCGNHKTCTSEINFASICKEYINCDEYIPCQLEKCQEVIYTYDVMCESFSCTTSDGGDSHVLKTFLILFFLTLFAITIFCCYKCRKRIRQQGQ